MPATPRAAIIPVTPFQQNCTLIWDDATKVGAVVGYGQFLTLAVNFTIVAFVLFLVIRAMNSLKSREEAKPEAVAEVPADVKLLSEIRDLLAARRG